MPQERALLQAASVIGRRFDVDLLAAVVQEDAADIEKRLVAIEAHGLAFPEGRSDDYLFKHALVRDVLHHSLLSRQSTALHLKIANEIEGRSGNRMAEVAEVPAHHYRQTDRSGKAFVYLSMAGAKRLGVYSLDEADPHFSAAIALLDQNPDCAIDQQVAELLANYSSLLFANIKLRDIVTAVDRYLPRLDRLGDNCEVVVVLHYYIYAHYYMYRFRESAKTQNSISLMAGRLRDDKAIAYSLAEMICASTVLIHRQLMNSRILLPTQLLPHPVRLIAIFKVGYVGL